MYISPDKYLDLDVIATSDTSGRKILLCDNLLFIGRVWYSKKKKLPPLLGTSVRCDTFFNNKLGKGFIVLTCDWYTVGTIWVFLECT